MQHDHLNPKTYFACAYTGWSLCNHFLFVLSSEKLEIWIYVITNCLLQTHDTYTLMVQGVDMNGAPSGNTGTGTVQIHILDINDNVPTLEKEEVRS